MKVGIIGSGGREHAICHSLNKSKKIKKIYCFPGNAGTAEIAENIDLNLENFNELKEFILKYSIDLIIVGPEKPLVEGIVDFLENNQIKVFGPNKFASQLEGSKIFTKKLCEKYNIPTAKFGIFKNFNDAQNFLEKIEYPTVVKADNLASGKGVYICTNFNEASNAVKEIFDGKFGEAENVLIEEFLKGEEMSYFIITDGKTISKFGTAQDHKRALEGDLGKNTGGMGAYSPSRLFNKELDEKIINKIINPTIKGIEDFGSKYKGFLYAGLMIVKDEPYLIEYNVRMGDPECQTIIPKLETDLLDIFVACCDEKLREIQVKWVDQKSLCVVLCSKGYPETFEKNVVIKNFNSINLDEKDYLFHAGTKKNNNQIFATGGRVLNFVSLSDNFYDAREKIHKNLESLNWENGYYRKDIGYKVID
jgi:phosphoribosylamine---glycine ligase